jgi:multidrug efflux system membrane fusion protein
MKQTQLRPLQRLSALAFGALSGLALLAGCDRGGGGEASAAAAASMPQRPPAAVTVAVAQTREVPIYIDQIGRCVAKESVTIQPQVDGRLMAAHFVEGAMASKDDLLFEIDPRPFQAELDRANATLRQHQENRRLAATEWSRVEKLEGTNAMSQTDIDLKRNAVAIAEAQVKVGEAAVETAKLNLEYCTIKSPLTGRAGARMVDPGNIVKNNETKLVTIQQMDPIYADFTVPENDFGTVRKYIYEGLLARPTFASAPGESGASTNPLKVLVDVPGDSATVLAALGVAQLNPATQPITPATQPGKAGAREGVLTFLDNTVQDASGTIRLRATLPNADQYFWPGQFVKVRVILSTKSDAVLVPAAAIQIGQQGQFLYVVKEDSTAEIRPVIPGQRQGDLIVIDQGVNPGEQVIVTGQMMVAPGAKVMVTNPAPGVPTSTAMGTTR